jgi:hypothetical protein
MMYSSNASRFALVLAAACNAVVTSATMLRGNLPITSAVGAPVESLADAAHSRILLGSYAGQPPGNLAVQSAGAEIAFASPPTTITQGNVCGDSGLTGDPVLDGVGSYDLLNGTAYIGGCDSSALNNLRTDAMAKIAKPMLSGAIGGLTFIPGTYSSATSFTVADNTNVTLKGGPDDIFLFLSGSYIVTGANTHFILEADGASGPPQAKNILFVLTAYATTGADSTIEGSILAGAAITHGARSKVSGYVLATAAMTVGQDCILNSDSLTANSVGTSPVETLINEALCYTNDNSTTLVPLFADCAVVI